MKKTVFTGAATAIITPFKDGKIDYESFAKLINWQIDEGIDAIVVCGTTGEASTLTDEEHRDAIKFCVDTVRGRVPVIAGTGSNDTAYAIELTAHACEAGADAVLVVTPYYNKGTAMGITKHYKMIASETDMPILLYNVPSRTGVNLGIDAIEELSGTENIVGIKEASDSVDRLTELSAFGEAMPIYAGNDTQIAVTMALGGCGAISVASNIIPRRMLELMNNCLLCKYNLAKEEQNSLLPFIRSLFSATNPAPIKYLMARCGMISGEIRLPLSLPDEESIAKIEKEYSMLEYGAERNKK
jgi:4-hydroxy-tetrahydrodipicolinate synthase